MTPARGWVAECRRDEPRRLHDPWPSAWSRRQRRVAMCRVSSAAVVLGSTQPADVLDVQRTVASGFDVVRRRSGGGAVLVGPDAQVWVDVWLPRDDPLWRDDVVRAAWWLGEVWSRTLESLGVSGTAVHRGRLRRAEGSDLVCFAGVGPGEVTVRGRKLVGVAQHRDRCGARVQMLVPVTGSLDPLLDVLQVELVPSALRKRLARRAVGLHDVLAEHGGEHVVRRVEDAFLAALP